MPYQANVSIRDRAAPRFGIGGAAGDLLAPKRLSRLSEQSVANRLIFGGVYRYRPLSGRAGWIVGRARDGGDFATPLDLLELDGEAAAALLRDGHRIGPATSEQADTLALHLGHSLRRDHDRDDSDYLYAADELRTLEGPHFAKARQYGRRLRGEGVRAGPFRPADAGEARRLVDAWKLRRVADAPCDTAESHSAIDLAAAQLIEGVVVRGNGEMLGFLLFDATIDEMIVALILKTDTRIQGLTDFCFQACALDRPGKRFINSCQDLGVPGLRARKLAMRPVAILPKYYLSLPRGEGAPR